MGCISRKVILCTFLSNWLCMWPWSLLMLPSFTCSCLCLSSSLKGCPVIKNVRLVNNTNNGSVYIIVVTVYVGTHTEWHTSHFTLEAICDTSSVKKLLHQSVYLLQVYCMCNYELVSWSDIHESNS
jgi:hypothetical protein